MNDTMLALGALILVGILFYFISRASSATLKIYLKSLAESPCPVCNCVVGRPEAEQAVERAWEFAKQNVMARVDPMSYPSWPTICPNCNSELVYWIADKTLSLRKKESSASNLPPT